MRVLLAALFLLPLPAFADSLASAHVTTTWDGSLAVDGITINRLTIPMSKPFDPSRMSLDLATMARAATPDDYEVTRGLDFVSRTFWLHGTGSGFLSLSIPYTLTVDCHADGHQPQAQAFASVRARIGPGTGAMDEAFADCENPYKEGILRVSRGYHVSSSYSPLITLMVEANILTVAQVPESPWLLVVGLVASFAVYFFRGRC